MLQVLICVLFAGWLLYKWWIIPYSYWKKKGFFYIDAEFPYGSSKELSMMTQYQGYSLKKIYDQMGDKGSAGLVLIRRLNLVVKDPDLIKSIMLKDFLHFTDRTNVDNIKEPLSHHLFNVGGDKWKALRIKLSPTFTSGKLKLMFPLFEKCSENLLKQIDKMSDEIDMKNIIGRFTAQVLGSCAYGIDINSLTDEKNEFIKVVENLFTSFPLVRKLNFLMHSIIPALVNVIRCRFITVENENFLRSVVNDTMAYREDVKTTRNDFIDLLMEIRDQKDIIIDSVSDTSPVKKTVRITQDDLVAQVFVFLGAGYETSSSVSSYCLYELAMNHSIQEKLRNEILSHQPLTYQSLQEMTYLDMVVHETMRKYPTLPTLTRKCTKDYNMPDGTILEKGTRIIIPVYALHHDPKYFPEPDKFDPERFTQANKNNRPQFSYLPFGEGPRLCIGMRFGLLQVKMAVATVLSKYNVMTTENTVSPMKFKPTPLVSAVSHQIKLRLEPM